MDPFAEERRWHLAAEVAANLTEITRWEWSKHSEESAHLARRLADGIYEGEDPNDFADIVKQLSEAIDDGPADWLATLTTQDPDGEPVPEGFSRWRSDARRAFYALRADLFPDGRRTAA
jgi:hypothetical protein